MINPDELRILGDALQTLSDGYSDLPEFTESMDAQRIATVMQDVAVRMQDNYPYFHPRYAGQMLKPPHPVARIAYMLSLWVNPNNHALDGGIASSAMEKEAVAAIGTMFGYDNPLGHLCGGGTMANMEALWVARKCHPDKIVVASEQAHYTHSRISEVLGLGFQSIDADNTGRMDMGALEEALKSGTVGTVVATLGTTGVGAVDPLGDMLQLQQKHAFRIHVDAAYGGYFTIAAGLGDAARTAFDHIGQADSIVIDPHKQGLQPYGCGCILFRDPEMGAHYKHDSPYTYFSSAELHLGEISLECSRPGAAAVALWATQQLLPMERGGEFAASLDKSLAAAQSLWQQMSASKNYQALMQPQTDIVVYGALAADAVSASEKAEHIFAQAAEQELHLALIELPVGMVTPYWPELEMNRPTVRCLRSSLMKPEHLDWLDSIVTTLEDVAE